MKKKRPFAPHRDINAERLYKAGQNARDAGQLVSACPSLGAVMVSEKYASQCEASWRSGWFQREAELVKERSNRHAMKGSD